MIDALSLYVKSVAASAAGVVAAVAASEAAPAVAPWLYGSAGIAFIGAVWGYGRLHGRIEAHDEALKRIEAKLDAALPDLAVALDRTEAK